jgi:hypothetical protein
MRRRAASVGTVRRPDHSRSAIPRGSPRFRSGSRCRRSRRERGLRHRVERRWVDAVEWATVATAVATFAAAVSARSSAQASKDAVRRSNMPFVWPAYEVEYGEEEPMTGMQANTVRTVLHNDGPGVAIDVRWSMWSPTEGPGRWHPYEWQWVPSRVRRLFRRWLRDTRADAESKAGASTSIRAMQPGEEVTSTHTVQFLEGEPAWVVVRYSDSAGERWEYVDPAAPRDLAGLPTRVCKYDHW